ncbi:MAG: hypothetical protein ACRCZC_05590, partial [Culicoidibacterales bacterium]
MSKKLKNILVTTLIASVLLVACGETDVNEVKIPNDASTYQDENYQVVEMELERAGFTNIETEDLEDLKLALGTKPGGIEQISIDGTTEFDAGTAYPKDVRIVIYYHSFVEAIEQPDRDDDW